MFKNGYDCSKISSIKKKQGGTTLTSKIHLSANFKLSYE